MRGDCRSLSHLLNRLLGPMTRPQQIPSAESKVGRAGCPCDSKRTVNSSLDWPHFRPDHGTFPTIRCRALEHCCRLPCSQWNVNDLSSEIGMPGVAERLGDDMNEHVVEIDRSISPPWHGARCVKLQRLDRCIRGLTRVAIVPDDGFPRFVRPHEEVCVILNSISNQRLG